VLSEHSFAVFSPLNTIVRGRTRSGKKDNFLVFTHQPNCSLSYSGFFHMYDLGVSYTFHFHKKNSESSVIFLRNDVLILNGKENKEASAICFEIRIQKKKDKELLRKVPSKIYEVILLWKKTKKNLVC
jgi:hypothetical protein